MIIIFTFTVHFYESERLLLMILGNSYNLGLLLSCNYEMYIISRNLLHYSHQINEKRVKSCTFYLIIVSKYRYDNVRKSPGKHIVMLDGRSSY